MYSNEYEKKSVCVWRLYDGNCPVSYNVPTYLSSHVQGLDRVYNEFIEENYTPFIKFKYKTIGKHNVNNEDINVIFVPCVDFTMLLRAISCITQYTYNFCKQNEITIVLSYILECLTDYEIQIVDTYIDHFYIKKNRDISRLRIVVNGYDILQSTKHRNVIQSVNFFDKKMRLCMEHPVFNITQNYNFRKNRNYNFSIIFGAISDRYYRLLFLSRCIEESILNNKTFFTVINNNNVNTERFAKKHLSHDRFNAVLPFLKHKIFCQSGNQLNNSVDIYDGIEYQIPYQVTDSYVTIVNETRVDTPSITEKIYKPIICGIPFLWHGYKNISLFLIKCGYKMYPFIDYTFDTLSTPEKRMEALIDEIKRLQTVDLQESIIKYKDISLYNKDVFMASSSNNNSIITAIT